MTDDRRTVRHSEVSPAEGAADELTRNALLSLTRNSEMLDLLVTALLPLLSTRSTNNLVEIRRGAAERTDSLGERLTGNPGGQPGQGTQHASPPVFLVKE